MKTTMDEPDAPEGTSVPGRTVVISGGGTGIGRAIADSFVASGDRVVLLGRRAGPLDEARRAHPDGTVLPIQADLTNPDSVLQVAETLEGTRIEVIVNNAGSIGGARTGSLHERVTVWRDVMEQNLMSAMILSEVLWPAIERPGGRIVTISSIAGQRGGGGAYGAAKAGLLAWSAELARRGGKEGITSNVVAPGYVAGTEFFGTAGRSPRHETLVAETLVGRAGKPNDIARAVQFLASNEADWITGQVLSVNGGALL